MKAAIYSRKSKFTGKGDSIENQIQLCMDYAKSIGIKEFLIYEDEGFSGGNIDRPQFKKMMQDAKDKKFDCLVCYRLDRISRNVSDFSTLIEKLNKLEISFISIKEQFDTSTPMGRAMMFISSVFAQLERETIAERIKDNMYELARSGRWLGGKTPHGFTSKKISFLDENLKERSMYQLEVNDEQMEIVKLIFNKYLELRSLSQLYKYVYHNGIKGPRGGKFDPSSLSGILRNPAYVKANEDILDYLRSLGMEVVGVPDGQCGILTYAKNTSNSIAAIAKHHGVIEPDIWLEVQSILNENKDKIPRISTGKTALLSGLLKCGKCGANMRIMYKGKRNDEDLKYYYVCGTKRSLGVEGCNCKNLNGPLVENLVIDKIKNCNIESVINAFNSNKAKVDTVFSDVRSEIDLFKNSISEKEKLIGNLVMELAKNTGSVASEYIISQIESLNGEIDSLKSKVSELESSSVDINSASLNLDIIVSNLKKFNYEVDDASLDDKRLLLFTIVDSIVWDDASGNLSIVYMGAKMDDLVSLSDGSHFCSDGRCTIYKSATSENDIINSPKQNIDSSSELKDVDSVDINYTDLTTPELKENTFGQRLRKSRLELGLSVKDVADICKITPSVVNGYELERFYPSKEILDLLSSTFNVNYLCSDGYTNLILNYDIFIENLKIWISDNNFTTQIAADKLGVSRSLLRFWFNGGTMRISLYNKIKGNLAHYNLI